MMKIGVLVSGGGTNLQALLDAKDHGQIPNGEIAVVVSSKAGAFALERAKKHGIDTAVLSPKSFENGEAFDRALVALLEQKGVELVVLAGFMTIVGPAVVNRYKNAILNVHPALIPAFCGKGFYGIHVHERVLEYGVRLTGATVHFVDEVPDGGPILLQKAVEVLEDDTPEVLQRRVMEQAEWELLPRAVDLVTSGKVRVEGRRVRIVEEL